MTRPVMTDDDWAIVYMAWMNDLPLSDTIWRWAACKSRAAEFGHCGSCIKQPGSCGLCTQEECLEGGKQMAAAWKVAAEKEPPVNHYQKTLTMTVDGVEHGVEVYSDESGHGRTWCDVKICGNDQGPQFNVIDCPKCLAIRKHM